MLTVMDSAVSAVVHSQLSASPPFSVRVTLLPAQTSVAGEAVMWQAGLALTVTLVVLLAVQPLLLVTVKV